MVSGTRRRCPGPLERSCLFHAFAVAAAFLVLTTGCATLGGAPAQGRASSRPASEAEALLARGDEALAGRNFPEAQQLYESVKTKYPFLEVAKTAELRLADTDFEREQFLEARERYQSFARLHPSHPKVDYAAFRAALTHFRDVPSDFFLLPSGAEKDQVELKNALTAMGDFLRAHPNSPLRAEAQTVVRQVQRRLASHELYVARFYAKRERWGAAVARIATLLRSYPSVGLDDEALTVLDGASAKMTDSSPVREVLSAYLAAHAGTPDEARARRILAKIPSSPAPPAPPAPPTLSGSPPPPPESSKPAVSVPASTAEGARAGQGEPPGAGSPGAAAPPQGTATEAEPPASR